MAALIDNSKIECFLRCPRRYFYRYGLGWKSDRTSVHLVWGEAWHRVLAGWYGEVRTQPDKQDGWFPFFVNGRIKVGESYYREHFSPADDADNAPKTCAALGECFKDYVEAYAEEDKGYTTLAVEVGFKLEIAPGVWMSGRVDRIAQDELTGDLVVQDHKSAGRLPDAKGVSQWQMSGQAATYLTAVKRKFPQHHVREFQVNMVVPRIPTSKLKTGLQRISVQLTDEQLELWAEEAERLTRRILFGQELMQDDELRAHSEGSWVTEHGILLRDFNRNPTSCYDFGSLCSYFDQCSTWVNPLDHIGDGPPRGMTVEHWDPLEDLKCSEVWELPLQ